MTTIETVGIILGVVGVLTALTYIIGGAISDAFKRTESHDDSVLNHGGDYKKKGASWPVYLLLGLGFLYTVWSVVQMWGAM